jgi:Tfp pilus assembly protein PilZ
VLAPLKEGAVATRPQTIRRTVERRNNGLLRVPFIRRCALAFEDGTSASTFTVNINVLGAYVARDQMPQLHQAVTITLATPGKDVQLVLRGNVTWLNPRQQHPVHSLPPGFGVKFDELSPEDRRCIEGVVDEYARRNPHGSNS